MVLLPIWYFLLFSYFWDFFFKSINDPLWFSGGRKTTKNSVRNLFFDIPIPMFPAAIENSVSSFLCWITCLHSTCTDKLMFYSDVWFHLPNPFPVERGSRPFSRIWLHLARKARGAGLIFAEALQHNTGNTQLYLDHFFCRFLVAVKFCPWMHSRDKSNATCWTKCCSWCFIWQHITFNICLFSFLSFSSGSYPLLRLPLPGTGPVEFTTGVRDYRVPSHESQGDLGERPDWVY